jgi:predicted nucleic acid-binding protein
MCFILPIRLRADALLTDDSDAWKEAERRNIPHVRTCGTLERAARRGLLDLPTAMARLLCVPPGQKEKGCGL